jgi:PAS domain S-box-containing protein
MAEPLQILILEDNPSDVFMLQRELTKARIDFVARNVMTRSAYIEALDQLVPDLILSDNSMPGFTASEALAIYHERRYDFPFILVTGTVSEEFAAGVILQGADDYILKGSLIRLPSAIAGALAHRQAKRAERSAVEELRRSEKNLKAIFNNTMEGFLLTDDQMTIKLFNEHAEKYTAYNTNERIVIGKSLYEYIHPDRIDEVKKMLQKVLSGERISYDRYYEREGMEPIWVHFAITPVYENAFVTGTCINSRDVTWRKKAEEKLLDDQKEVSRAIIDAQENERKYLGQELHDNINQILAGVKIFLDKVIKDHPELSEEIGYPLQLVDLSMVEIRKLCNNLVTTIGSDGLEEIIRIMLKNVAQSLDIKIQIEYRVTEVLHNELALNIYRIIQEQVNNIIKHAAANMVTIRISTEGEDVLILVADNGKGFDVEENRKGIGLKNMAHRVESFDGDFSIDSAVGKGCRVHIRLPLEKTKSLL